MSLLLQPSSPFVIDTVFMERGKEWAKWGGFQVGSAFFIYLFLTAGFIPRRISLASYFWNREAGSGKGRGKYRGRAFYGMGVNVYYSAKLGYGPGLFHFFFVSFFVVE